MSDEPRNGNQRTSPVAYGLLIFFIFAILWIAVFYFPKARRDAQRTACLNNLKSLGVYISMYAEDHNNCLPNVSGFGTELDKHKALWDAKGDIFNPRSKSLKYFPEVCYWYIKNTNILICPSTGTDAYWNVPDGQVHITNISFTFNAWCRFDTTKKPPDGCLKIAGMNLEKVYDVASAPIMWDTISGYSQAAHGDEINVLYMDFHVNHVELNPQKPPYNATTGISGHFWGAPDPNNPHGTLGAVGWSK